MGLNIQENIAVNEFPPCGIFMGAPKVGKSTFMSQIPDALILNLEKNGYKHINCKAIAPVKTKKELINGIDEYLTSKYKVLIIDHLREVVTYLSARICKDNDVDCLSDIGWNNGYKKLTGDLSKFLSHIIKHASSEKRIFLVAHTTTRKKSTCLDVDGTNEEMILGLVDFAGNIYQAGEKQLNVNFKAKSGTEYGIRNKALSSYDGPADYNKILEIART